MNELSVVVPMSRYNELLIKEAMMDGADVAYVSMMNANTLMLSKDGLVDELTEIIKSNVEFWVAHLPTETEMKKADTAIRRYGILHGIFRRKKP